jgi:hypothetical protein
MFSTHKESILQAYELINTMKEEDLKNTIELMQHIIKGGIVMYQDESSKLYADIPNTFLKIITYDSDLGPKNVLRLKTTPFNIPVTKIIDDYIIHHAEKFTGVPEGYVLKDNRDVVMRKGYKVVYKNYYFYIFCNGCVSFLFVNEKDLNRYVVSHDKYSNLSPNENDDNYLSREKGKYYVACTEKLQILIPIDELEHELKIREERRGYYG